MINNTNTEGKDMAINKEKLKEKFKNYTGCDDAKSNKHVSKYLAECAKQVIIDNFSSDAGHGYFINATAIDSKLGSIIVNGQRKYIWSIIQQFNERVFDIIAKGNNIGKKLTMANSQYTLEEIIMAGGTCEELWHHVYDPLFKNTPVEGVDYDIVPIDMVSLGNYIKDNLTKQEGNVSIAYSEALRRNLKHAQKIYMLASAADGDLIQVINNSVFGRKYYTGPNLQNVPKEVRHAALGECWEYDIECSVFAWKLDAYKDCAAVRGESVSASYTLEYIDSKKQKRKELAKLIFGTDKDWAVGIVKEFITAIGFGANKNSKGYVENGVYHRAALNEIITSREKLDIALSDPWINEFINEQSVMNKYILDTDNIGKDLKSIPQLQTDKGRFCPNAAMAYLYQQSERRLLNDMLTVCEGRDLLLTVHDCFYIRRKLGDERIAQLKEICEQHGKYYKVGKTLHTKFSAPLESDDDMPPNDPRRDISDGKKVKHYTVRPTVGNYDAYSNRDQLIEDDYEVMA